MFHEVSSAIGTRVISFGKQLTAAQALEAALRTARFYISQARGGDRFASQLNNTASASISTKISGEMSALTWIIDVAGRISLSTSPWAFPIFSHSAMFVT